MLTIRKATHEDAEVISALYGKLYGTLEGFGLPFCLNSGELRRIIDIQLKSNLCHFAVAEADGIIRGFISAGIVRIDRKLAFEDQNMMGIVNDLYVDEAFRRSGVALRLVENTEAWLKENNIAIVECNVLASNNGALNFWHKNRYTEMSRTLYKKL